MHIIIAQHFPEVGLIFIGILVFELVDLWTQIDVWRNITSINLLLLFKSVYLANNLHGRVDVSLGKHEAISLN